MRDREIINVHIIAHAGSIRRRIIGSKDRNRPNRAKHGAQNIGTRIGGESSVPENFERQPAVTSLYSMCRSVPANFRIIKRYRTLISQRKANTNLNI